MPGGTPGGTGPNDSCRCWSRLKRVGGVVRSRSGRRTRNIPLLFEVGPGHIVASLQNRKDEPIVIGKPRGHEKPPDRQHRTNVLRMTEEGKGKTPAPGDVIAQFVSVEDADLS